MRSAAHPARLTDLLSRLKGVRPRSDRRNWDCLCPSHQDRNPSLSVGIGDNGDIVVCCQKGCRTEDVMRSVGMTMADLHGDAGELNGHGPKSRIAATYDYLDEGGVLLFQTVRLDPKSFRQRRPKKLNPRWDSSEDWEWNLSGVRRVLYRLPELLAADPAEWVFLAEGEKDVEALRKWGLVATTNPMGAEKWKDEYSPWLKGRKVILLQDNDESGKKHVEQVAKSLKGVAAEVRAVLLPGLREKGDVSDWIAGGGTKEKLLEHVKDRAPAEPKKEEWEPPIPLDDDAGADPFPITVLPSAFADFFTEAAGSIGCPLDYVACFGLAVVAGATGALYAVDIKEDYPESLSLFLAIVAPKGSKKTPALKAVAKPIYDEAARRQHASNDTPVYLSDVTAEKVADVLQEVRRGIPVIRDELSGWFNSMDQYKAKGSGSDRQFWLSVNSGDPVSVHRKDPAKPPVFVRHPCVTVVGGIQPPVLSRLKGDDDGFFDRVLFTYPEPLPARGEDWAVVSRPLLNRWCETILRIINTPMVPHEEYGYRPYFLKLTNEARRAWEEWTSWSADQQNSEDFPEWLKGPLTKMTGFAARLAGIVHVMREQAGETTISVIEGQDMEAGAILARYFLSHAQKVYRAMGRDPRVGGAMTVMRWVRGWGKPTFSRRDVWRALRRQFSTPEDLAPPLKLLAAHGYIRWVNPAQAGHTKGHSTVYEINPLSLVTGDSGDSGATVTGKKP